MLRAVAEGEAAKCRMSTDSIFNIVPASLTLGAVLARGSPGITLYKADLLLGQRTLQVAVKRLNTSEAPPDVGSAFLKEIQILQLAAGTCQRACRMLGCCKLDGDPCIVMSLYPKSAAKLLEDHAGPVPIPELVSLAVEVLAGLAELHEAKIWHLDLKPPNILLDQYGHAYLSDFGISYALRTLQDCTVLTRIAGTPHYMAPEQTDADFGARGPHTDVWGFGTTLLHLATGQQPYKDLTLVQMVTAMTKARPPAVPHSLPAWLQLILQQCFSFDVTKRPPVQQLLQVFKAQLLNQHNIASISAGTAIASTAGTANATPSTSVQGTITYPNGDVDVGEQQNGKRHGQGKISSAADLGYKLRMMQGTLSSLQQHSITHKE
ncbi:hypothetical protein WJX82_002693 [Trebouxia sp. C0006]